MDTRRYKPSPLIAHTHTFVLSKWGVVVTRGGVTVIAIVASVSDPHDVTVRLRILEALAGRWRKVDGNRRRNRTVSRKTTNRHNDKT